ncbi:MAG TPA: DNA repair protein RecO [Gammaproteobacteria bacterium]|jgi:DNA repair protein RecO (recombination protein O)|nr:DNA repair protein RecO [Gammaproteobacteria bacterium]
MAEREQVLLEPAFVLHQRPYRNTSQLLECVTATHGRVGLVARGSRRTGSGQRALLQPFVPLRLSWLRRGELGRLTHVEAAGASHDLAAQRLLGGYYANELLLRLTARSDPNAEIFSCYSRCLAELAETRVVARPLRVFELGLLHALGYGIELDSDAASGEPLTPETRYVFEVEQGVRRAAEVEADADVYLGRDLIALRERRLDDDMSLRAAQRLLGRVLRAHLGERPLQSRLVLQDIVSRGL